MSDPTFAFVLLVMLPALGLAAAQIKPSQPRVGVVDDKLLPQNDWVAKWAADWEATKIVAQFQSCGVRAEIVDAETLRNLAKLKVFDAIVVPTDHGYPDEGARVGPVAQALTAYVREGERISCRWGPPTPDGKTCRRERFRRTWAPWKTS